MFLRPRTLTDTNIEEIEKMTQIALLQQDSTRNPRKEQKKGETINKDILARSTIVVMILRIITLTKDIKKTLKKSRLRPGLIQMKATSLKKSTNYSPYLNQGL